MFLHFMKIFALGSLMLGTSLNLQAQEDIHVIQASQVKAQPAWWTFFADYVPPDLPGYTGQVPERPFQNKVLLRNGFLYLRRDLLQRGGI